MLNEKYSVAKFPDTTHALVYNTSCFAMLGPMTVQGGKQAITILENRNRLYFNIFKSTVQIFLKLFLKLPLFKNTFKYIQLTKILVSKYFRFTNMFSKRS